MKINKSYQIGMLIGLLAWPSLIIVNGAQWDESLLFIVPRSMVSVEIDGHLVSQTPNFNSEWWDASRFVSGDLGMQGFMKHNITHLFIGLWIEDLRPGQFDWIHIIFDEGKIGSWGGGNADGEFSPYSEDYKFLFYDKNEEHTYYGDGFYLGNNTWYGSGGPAYPSEFTGAMQFLLNHWEVEIVMPLQGWEGIPFDPSDLTLNVGDIFGFYVAFTSSDDFLSSTTWHRFPDIPWAPTNASELCRSYLYPGPSPQIQNIFFIDIILLFIGIGVGFAVIDMKREKKLLIL